MRTAAQLMAARAAMEQQREDLPDVVRQVRAMGGVRRMAINHPSVLFNSTLGPIAEPLDPAVDEARYSAAYG